MFRRPFYFALAAALAYIAYLLAGFTTQEEKYTTKKPLEWPGKNNTVLFLSNSEHGLANVLLATSHALLVEHNDLDIHFVSFEKLKNDIATISKFAAQSSGSKRAINFHELKGISYAKALNSRGFAVDEAINAPGITGLGKFCKNMQSFLMPWTAPDYLDLYREIFGILEDIDPIVVALDPLFGPALDAVRAQGRNHAIISPNTLKDNFAHLQPRGAVLWKYPAMSSGYAYPVPWYLIPSNIYLNLRLAFSIFVAPDLKEKKSWLKKNGIAKPLDVFTVYHEDHPWLTQSSRELDYPFDIIPENVIQCGPIFLSTAPASEQDPELAKWLKKSPTVLINLGSSVNYDEIAATEMVRAIRILLDNSTVQILWKFNKRHEFTDEFLDILDEEIKSGRVRMSKWIQVDPAALLETGDVVVSIHHGGANCFHEAIGTGIPQVVLPMWADLYDFAVRAEYLGVGLWGSRNAAPNWTAEELSTALLKVTGDGQEAVSMREKALELSKPYKEKPGRITAAHELAKLARLASTS
ncbi:glycosyltransferase family 1 protein [Sclerotinia borealis F-4128]|uniref:Glycosyltransferase family 1 protein n=1 Tax=Sclerotinia borealis (strain F-4128) TaxID=1432307 RepID=W9CKE4_SCLBF|nr:glycosyltransferase family 1 protein [Sclerotinia borealis F-4128]